jgi:mono/diheme cytochrome c family protein
MLSGFDKVLAIVVCVAAVVTVVMLFAGPIVVAEDKPEGEAGNRGQAVFTENCGSCHTLSRAGTNGSVGPNLDDISIDPAGVEAVVRNGTGSMPSFEGQLSDADITAVAQFVAGQSYSAPPN